MQPVKKVVCRLIPVKVTIGYLVFEFGKGSGNPVLQTDAVGLKNMGIYQTFSFWR